MGAMATIFFLLTPKCGCEQIPDVSRFLCSDLRRIRILAVATGDPLSIRVHRWLGDEVGLSSKLRLRMRMRMRSF